MKIIINRLISLTIVLFVISNYGLLGICILLGLLVINQFLFRYKHGYWQ